MICCDNKANHVIGIDIVKWGLGSEISTSLLELKYLEHLNLQGNNFSSIPSFIGGLTRLTYLNLETNPLSGTLPSQLGNLTSLSFLALGGTILYPNTILTVTDFRWISRLSFLQKLRLVFVISPPPPIGFSQP